MSYQIDEQGRVWLDGGVIVPDSSHMWDDYLEWVDEGNEPTPRAEP